MKYLYIFGLLSFLTLTISAQNIDSKYLTSDWYRIKNDKIQKPDTLIFNKSRKDSTFRLWSFKSTGELRISSGYEMSDKTKAGLYFTAESEKYNWNFDKQKNTLLINSDRRKERYLVIEISESRLVLIRIE
jgi:hypothetical protein